MVPNERYRVAIGLQHGFARYGVEFNIIARVYSGAGPAAIAGEFCSHGFNGHIFLYCYRTDCPHMAAATAMH